MAEQADGGDGKSRRRQATKPAARADGKKVKTTINLSGDAARRLAVHAAYMSLDKSALVERLIMEHLRRYIVSDRGGATDMASDEAAA